MPEPLENLYFNWLCAKVMQIDVPTPSLTHWKLLRQLYSSEFIWLLPTDDSRAEDGKELRYRFLVESHLEGYPLFENEACSVLEAFVALANRAEFVSDIPASEWFWMFLDNLNLTRMDDACEYDQDYVEWRLVTFMFRTFSPDGRGGIFPMRHTARDQRTVDIWYQFHEYYAEMR